MSRGRKTIDSSPCVLLKPCTALNKHSNLLYLYLDATRYTGRECAVVCTTRHVPVGLIILLICSMFCSSGDSPPCIQKIFSSTIAATGRQLKQSVNVFQSLMLYRLLPGIVCVSVCVGSSESVLGRWTWRVNESTNDNHSNHNNRNFRWHGVRSANRSFGAFRRYELVDTGSFTFQFSAKQRPYGEIKQASASLNYVTRIVSCSIEFFWCFDVRRRLTGWLAYIHRRSRIFYLWKRIRDFLEEWRNSRDILSYTLITDRLSQATAFLDQHNLCVIRFNDIKIRVSRRRAEEKLIRSY